MKFRAIFLLSLLYSLTTPAQSYIADVRKIDSKDQKVLFTINVEKKKSNNKETIVARSSDAGNLALEEVAVINTSDSSLIEYNIDNKQTQEKGKILFTEDKIQIEYTAFNKATEKTEISRPKNLVAPANFEQFLQNNFETLKKEKSMTIDFLVWDRRETYKFKVTYLGETILNGETTHHFKMNINNFIIATFVTPIQMWYSQDMKQIRRFLGRVSVKQKNSDGSYSNLDADVNYKYK